MWDTGKDKKEKAILVTIRIDANDPWSVDDYARELKELACASGVKVVKEIISRREKPTPGFFIGKGKVHEISSLVDELKAEVVIFNEDLSSTQQRNLEVILGIKTIDRTQLILDIFAQRAKSSEGKVQVELAQLEYLLPRLTGKGVLLSRLGGGIGTRGPGEKKLEVDRRRIRMRVSRLRKELINLSKRRASLREHRKRSDFATVAIVGYTNAGKSTLINALTGSDQLVRGKMFSTLDSVSRGVTLTNKQKVLFSDTVGFLHRLPHRLIEAFKATLEEVKEADVLLHVLDASSPYIHEQNDAVYEVLCELKAQHKPMIVALNKVDLVDDEFGLKRYFRDFQNSVAVSALKRMNIGLLLEKLSVELSGLMSEAEFLIPMGKMHLIPLLHRQGTIIKKTYHNDSVYIHAKVPQALKNKLKKFCKKTFDKE